MLLELGEGVGEGGEGGSGAEARGFEGVDSLGDVEHLFGGVTLDHEFNVVKRKESGFNSPAS